MYPLNFQSLISGNVPGERKCGLIRESPIQYQINVPVPNFEFMACLSEFLSLLLVSREEK